MIKLMIAAILLFACHPAQARHLRAASACDNIDVMRPCAAGFMELGSTRGRSASKPRHATLIRVRHLTRNRDSGTQLAPERGTADRGLVAPLAAKVDEIVRTCGSRVISGIRHTLIAGTRQISLHAFGEAADVAGNPSCIYAELRSWPGGYSVDYGRVRHVHISYEPGGREWGARFAHGGGHGHYHHHRRALI